MSDIKKILPLIAFAELYLPSWRTDKVSPGERSKNIYRFYEDGTWTHNRLKGVIFECVAFTEKEAKDKFCQSKSNTSYNENKFS